MIAKKTAITAANTVVGGLLGLVSLHYITLYILPAELGGVRLAFYILGLAFFVTDLGLGPAHVKRVSEGVDEGDCFATFATVKAVATGAFLIVALAIMGYLVLAGPSKYPDFNVGSYLVLSLQFVALALRGAFQSTFDARQESARAAATMFTETLFRVASTIVIVFVIAALNRGAGPLHGRVSADWAPARWIAEHVEASIAIAYFIGAFASLLYAARAWKRGRGVVGRFRWDILRSYWAYALPIFLVGVIGTLSAYVDGLFLGFFWSKEEVGLLFPAQALRLFLEAIPYAVATLLFPTMSALHARDDWEPIRAMVTESMRYIGLLMIPVIAFVATFSREITHVFLSDKYLPAAAALSLLALYSLMIGLQRPYLALLAGTGRTELTARIGIAMTVSNIVLNFLLIPADVKSLGLRLAGLKMTGAALATLASGVLGLAMARYYARVAGRAKFGTSGPLAKQVAAALVMIGALLLLATVFPFDRWYAFPVYTVLGAGVYLGVLALLREIRRADVDLFVRTANLAEIWRYLRSEVFHRK